MSASRLHDRAHVVMVDELHALGRSVLGDVGQPAAELRPVAGAITGRCDSGLRAVAMDGVRGLGEDEDVGAHRLQQVEMRPQRAASPRRRRACSSSVEYQPEMQARPNGASAAFSAVGLARKLVAELHAVEAGLAAPPRGRSRAACRRRCSCMSSLDQPMGLAPMRMGMSVSVVLRQRRARRAGLVVVRSRASRTSGAVRDLRHGHVPPVAAGVGGGAAGRCRSRRR